VGAADILRGQLQRALVGARWLVDGLTDDEYFWEPAPGCWSVRPKASGARGYGIGEWVCEDGWPPPDPVPLTTIAWRVTHLAAWTDIYREWTFGEARPRLADVDVPGTAQAGVAWLLRSQDEFTAEVERLTDADIAELRPAHFGPDMSIEWLVSAIAREHIHHAAEIGVLRDVKSGHGRLQPPPFLE